MITEIGPQHPHVGCRLWSSGCTAASEHTACREAHYRDDMETEHPPLPRDVVRTLG